MTRPLPDQTTGPSQTCQVLVADDLFVSHGVNAGDALQRPDEVCPGDIYQLDPEHQPLRLVVTRPDDGPPRIGAGSAVGEPGQPLRFVAQYSLMGSSGDQVELVLLELADGTGMGLGLVLPLSPIASGQDYTLLQAQAATEATGLADLLCISFAEGVMITLATGRQCPIEALQAGDMVLTRDHGPQPVRWIGRATLRAVGVFAPVVITAGTLGNSGDLIVSQHHRIFLYQPRRSGAPRTSELLVQAKHLVDDERVFLRDGGFVNYYSLVFDRHEIIYAEGIPAESLMVNDATLSRLPPDMSAAVRAQFPGLNQNQHFGTEAGRQFLDELGPATLYKPGPRRKP